jgi:hypothetical protein
MSMPRPDVLFQQMSFPSESHGDRETGYFGNMLLTGFIGLISGLRYANQGLYYGPVEAYSWVKRLPRLSAVVSGTNTRASSVN